MVHSYFVSVAGWLFALGFALSAPAQTVSLDQLTLDPPGGTTNRLNISLQTSIGNDSDIADVSGIMSGLLDFSWQGGPTGQVVPTSFTFTGGLLSATDLQFSFLLGLVTITTHDVAGTPSTPNPPSVITHNVFNAMDHVVTLDRGTINAPGTTIDLTTQPIAVTGTGQGTIQVTSMGGDQHEAVFTLPVEFNEPFEVMNVPVVGTVTGNIVGSGTFVARQTFSVHFLPGDYNFDGNLDCQDIDQLQSQILAGSTNLLYDANGDGLVSLPDFQAWVTGLKGTLLGDANLDLSVDATDFNAWNANKFTAGRGWCQGDFNGDATVDAADFNSWNANKYTQADSGTRSVPEPAGLMIPAAICLLIICTEMRLTNVHIPR